MRKGDLSLYELRQLFLDTRRERSGVDVYKVFEDGVVVVSLAS